FGAIIRDEYGEPMAAGTWRCDDSDEPLIAEAYAIYHQTVLLAQACSASNEWSLNQIVNA
ncbi:hypothetical protein A2U01_0107629, partial [Trifolium medium]|nr:hypothetical protein [Trifolium medium]